MDHLYKTNEGRFFQLWYDRGRGLWLGWETAYRLPSYAAEWKPAAQERLKLRPVAWWKRGAKSGDISTADFYSLYPNGKEGATKTRAELENILQLTKADYVGKIRSKRYEVKK